MAEFNWRLPVATAAGACALLCLLFVIGPDADLLYIFLLAPLALLAFLALLIIGAVRKSGHQSLSVLTTIVVLISVSLMLLRNEREIRPWLRWHLLAHHFKAKVLAQGIPSNNEFRHVEWDGWGVFRSEIGLHTSYSIQKTRSSKRLRLTPPAESVESHATWTRLTGLRVIGIP